MENMNEIRRHIRAVEQTRKLTGAMHLISSARLKKMMPLVEYNALFLSHIEGAMHHILETFESLDLPYLRNRGARRNTYIVISGDKGMVGSYNAELLKFAWSQISRDAQCNIVSMGFTGSRFFLRNGMQPDIELPGSSQQPLLESARHRTQDLFRAYDERLVDQVFLIYTEYVNSAKWHPRIRRLLPVETENLSPALNRESMIYHPSPEEMFRRLVPQYTLSILYGAMMESYVSELCARKSAMQDSTNNADELLKKLTTLYNGARQAAITQEITEIMASAKAQTSGEDTSWQ